MLQRSSRRAITRRSWCTWLLLRTASCSQQSCRSTRPSRSAKNTKE
jgi:hypothetical protein